MLPEYRPLYISSSRVNAPVAIRENSNGRSNALSARFRNAYKSSPSIQRPVPTVSYMHCCQKVLDDGATMCVRTQVGVDRLEQEHESVGTVAVEVVPMQFLRPEKPEPFV